MPALHERVYLPIVFFWGVWGFICAPPFWHFGLDSENERASTENPYRAMRTGAAPAGHISRGEIF